MIAILMTVCGVGAPSAQAQQEDAPTLSVMTYNVKGLWWPLASGRGPAIETITQQLIAQRKAGVQPSVIVLQEAFRNDAKAIAARAGYRHIVFGPGREEAQARHRSAADVQFVKARKFLKGEHQGKVIGSGLVIASDFPIVKTVKQAFPRHACGGFDCLAAKGIVMAFVRVPGAAQPLAIATTHLNSRRAAGVSTERSNYAFAWQVDAIDAFFAAHLDPGSALIFAGDFNAAPFPRRRALLYADRPARAGLAFLKADSDALTGEFVHHADLSAHIVKDRHYIRHGKAVKVAPIGVRVPFGKEPDGSMLSDHIGYEITYQITPRSDVSARKLLAQR